MLQHYEPKLSSPKLVRIDTQPSDPSIKLDTPANPLSLIKTHISLHKRTPSRTAFTDVEARFIELLTGTSIASVQDEAGSEARSTLDRLRVSAPYRWSQAYDCLIDHNIEGVDDAYSRCLWICCELMQCIRSHGPLSLQRCAQKLKKQDAGTDQQTIARDALTQELLFNALGWTSMLFEPVAPGLQLEPDHLRIVNESTDVPLRKKVSIEKAQRPLDEVLRSFGGLLPECGGPIADSDRKLEAKAYVSSLNGSALEELGNIEIVWSDSISTHMVLELGPDRPKLFLFRWPSFCKLCSWDDSILSYILRDYYPSDEDSTPVFSAQKFMRELLLSYSLIFKHSRRARQRYMSHERKRAWRPHQTDYPKVVDTCLDLYCAKDVSARSGTKVSEGMSYDLDNVFPILKQRIARLQNFMDDQTPHSFWTLWRDKRDIKIWYTIWVVIILGVIGVIEQMVAIGLAGWQINLAVKANALSLQQINLAQPTLAPG